jgi:predicted esterase YcpF (UPF0227 family)
MLYYLHGYQSSPTSAKGTLFKEILHAVPIAYRTGVPEAMVIPHCLQRITDAIHDDSNVTLIGSSFGGFLAAATGLHHKTVKHLILLNPAIIPPQIKPLKVEGMPASIVSQMILPDLFTQKIPALITILRGTQDTVVPDSWVLEFAKAQEAVIWFLHDDHGFSKNLAKLPSLIQKILIEGSY